MKTSYEPELRCLTLGFEDRPAVEEFLDGVESNAGFLVQLSTALKLHDVVVVVLEADDLLGRFEARVAQVFDKGFGSFGTAMLVDDPTAIRSALAADPRSASPVGAPSPDAGAVPAPEDDQSQTSETLDDDADISDPGSDPSTRPVTAPRDVAIDTDVSESAEPEEGAPEPVDEGSAGEMMGTSPIHRINAMNPRERARLAQKAGRTERQILLRDKSPLVLESLLNNPRIDSEEVLRIARSSRVVAPTLQRIASDSRWNGNQEILAVIARHPKTPSVFATRLLPSLRISDLRMMAKMSSGLREMVRKAALREYMQRTGQRI